MKLLELIKNGNLIINYRKIKRIDNSLKFDESYRSS